MCDCIRAILCAATIFLASAAWAKEKAATEESSPVPAENAPISPGRQVGGGFVSPDWIDNPQTAKPYIKQNADMGFSSMILFVRSMRQTVLDKRVHDAVKAMVAYGHQCGLKMLLDTDHAWWGPSFVEAHPETALWAIRSVEATVQDGQFEISVVKPDLPRQLAFQEISAVFVPEGDGYRCIPAAGIECAKQDFRAPKPSLLLRGRLSEPYSGNAVFYVTVRTAGLVDVAHPRYLKGQEELLDSYADVPLDGFTWDEPGKGLGDLSCFKAGAGFLGLFERLHGYPLRSSLIYLDHCDGTPRATRVRCDYFGALIEMNYIAQKRHNDYARKLCRKELMFGTHQTWSGIPCDLAAGCVDYFKLGKVLSAAWTDGGWDFEAKYPILNFMLAEGIKKELGLRDAYYNDWGVNQHGVGTMQFANRLKMLFHVNWFSCDMSEFTEGHLALTQGAIRAPAEKDARNLDRFDRMVGEVFVPHTDIAFLYSWQSLAAAPKWLTRAYYTFLANTSLHLTDAAQYAAIMSGESIRRAEIGARCFKINGLAYRVLLLPYVAAIEEAVYRKAMQISEAGAPVIVIGPPPAFTTDGKAIGADFARRVGFKPFTFAQYARVLAEQTALPDANQAEPSWIDAAYPVKATTGKAAYDQEGHLAYVKSATGPLYYMPAPDPREELMKLLAALTTPLAETYAEGTYYRFFPHRDDPNQMVVVAAAKGHATSFGLMPESFGSARPPIGPHALKAFFRLKGGELILNGGTWCAVRISGSRVMEVIGDCPDVRWNGRRAVEASSDARASR